MNTTRSIFSYHQDYGDEMILKEKNNRSGSIDTYNIIHKYNIPFLTEDHLAPLYNKVFTDSNINKNFRYGKTKTTAILNEAKHPAIKSELLNYMLEQKTVHFVPFSNNRYWRVFYIMKLFSGLSNIQVLRSNI